MTGNFLEIRKLIRFNATGVVEKVGSTMREKSWRDTLCSEVDMTEGSNEGRKVQERKEGRKEERVDSTGQGDIVKAKPWREKCQKLQEYPVSCIEEEEEEEETSPTRRENRGAARPILLAVETQKGRRNKPWKRDETLPGNAIKPAWRTSTWFPKRTTRWRGEIWRRIKRRKSDLCARAGEDWRSRRFSTRERQTRAFESIVQKEKGEREEIADRSLKGEIAGGLFRAYYFRAWNAQNSPQNAYDKWYSNYTSTYHRNVLM